MAEVISRRSIVYDLSFNTKQAEKGANDIGKALDKTEKQIDDATKAVNDFADKTISAASRLRQIKNELNNFKGSEARFRELSIEAAKLTDQINNTNQRIRILASSTRNIQALTSAFAGLTGVFTAIQGAQALFGKESENVQRALVKLQGSLALLQGVQAAVATVTEQSAAKTIILDKAQKAYALTVQLATRATTGLKVAMASLGIGAIIAGIGLLITYWDDLKDAITGASDAQNKWRDNAKIRADYLDKLDEQTKKELEAARVAREAADGGIADIKRQIKFSEETGKTEEELFSLKQLLRNKELEELRMQQSEISELVGLTTLERETAINKLSILIKDKEAEIYAATKSSLKVLEEGFRKAEQSILMSKIEPTQIIVEGAKPAFETLDRLNQELSKLQEQFQKTFTGSEQFEQLKNQIEVLKARIAELTGVSKVMSESLISEYQAVLNAGAQTFNTLAGLAKDGSGLQIALAEISILADYAAAIAAAIKGATTSGAATGPAAIAVTPSFIATLVATTVGAFAQSFTTLQKAKSLQSGSNTATAFAEGEVDIHRQGEIRGKDSIPAIIMPGESVITTDKTKKYKSFLEAIHDGNLEDMIRVNYVEPALAVKAMDSVAKDSRIPDYSDRFYRQWLATGEGNVNGKRMVGILHSIDKKLTPRAKKYSH